VAAEAVVSVAGEEFPVLNPAVAPGLASVLATVSAESFGVAFESSE
jgi:hypothetical protein